MDVLFRENAVRLVVRRAGQGTGLHGRPPTGLAMDLFVSSLFALRYECW